MWTGMQEWHRANPDVSAVLPVYEDPLDPDAEGDAVVATTRRGLLRLVLVAAETATRFAREGLAEDPVAWMLSPRMLFDGRNAIDACLERDECLRAVLLHGLSMGMDADADEMDDLVAGEPPEADESLPPDVPAAADDGRGWQGGRSGDRPRLWTSLFVDRSDAGMVQAFDAVIAPGRAEAEELLRARRGVGRSAPVDLSEGFDASQPLVEALLSGAMTDMLEQVARDPASPLAEGLSVSVQQRFAA